jgi:hypothetical protein
MTILTTVYRSYEYRRRGEHGDHRNLRAIAAA